MNDAGFDVFDDDGETVLRCSECGARLTSVEQPADDQGPARTEAICDEHGVRATSWSKPQPKPKTRYGQGNATPTAQATLW